MVLKTTFYIGGIALVGGFSYYLYKDETIRNKIKQDSNNLINNGKEYTMNSYNYTKNKIGEGFTYAKDSIPSFKKED